MIFHPTKIEYIFFSTIHGKFSRLDHLIGQKTSLSKLEKIEIIQALFQSQWYETRNQQEEKWKIYK